MSDSQLNINKTVVKASGIVLLGLVLGKLIRLPLSIILVRNYGAADYGLLVLAIAITGNFAALALLGMNTGITRFLPLYYTEGELGKLKKVLVFGFKMVFILSLMVAVLVFFFSDYLSKTVFNNKDLGWIIRLLCFAIPFQAGVGYGLGVFRGQKKLHYILYSQNIANPSFRLLFVLALVLLGLGINYIAVSYVVVSFLTFVFVMALFTRDSLFEELKYVEPSGSVRDFLGFSFPLAGGIVVKFAKDRFDLLIIGAFMAIKEVGIYNVAMSLSLILQIPLMGINRILLPVASELFGKGDIKQLAETYKTMARWALTMILPFFFLLLLFSEEIIEVIYGHELVTASNSMRIISLGVLIHGATGSVGEFLQAFGKSKMDMVIVLTSTLLNVGGLFLLVPKFGMKGAACSYLIMATVSQAIGFFALVSKGIQPFSLKYVYTFAVGGLIFNSVFYPLLFGSHIGNGIIAILALFALGMVTYLTALYAIGIFTNEEKIIIRNIIKSIMKRKWLKIYDS